MTPDELTNAREKLGLSQSALARDLGISRVTLWRHETGKSDIPVLVSLAVEALMNRRIPNPNSAAN